MSDHDACEVPLAEQLRSVPKEFRASRPIQWAEDGTETGHQFIPVGFMFHRCADRIELLEGIVRLVLTEWERGRLSATLQSNLIHKAREAVK